MVGGGITVEETAESLQFFSLVTPASQARLDAIREAELRGQTLPNRAWERAKKIHYPTDVSTQRFLLLLPVARFLLVRRFHKLYLVGQFADGYFFHVCYFTLSLWEG